MPDEPDEVRLTFSRLHVEWNPETIAALLAFLRLPASAPAAEPSYGDASIYHSTLQQSMIMTPGVGGSVSFMSPQASTAASMAKA